MKYLLCFTALTLMGLLAACSDDDETPTGPSDHSISWSLTGRMSATAQTCDSTGYVVTVVGSSVLPTYGLTTARSSNGVKVTSATTGTNPGTTEFVVASGDTLRIATTGTWTIQNPDPLSIAQAGTFTVSGGSGIFKSATGSGTYTGTQTRASSDTTNLVSMSVVGTLKY